MTKQDGEALAREYNTPFFETSAMHNVNVDEAFHNVTAAVMRVVLEAEEQQNNRGRGGEKKNKDKDSQPVVLSARKPTPDPKGSCC